MLPTLSTDDPAGHVLFVDDDADVVKAAALLLARHGWQVSGARDPLQARSLLAAERIDVVLLDLNFTRGASSGEEGFRCLAQLLADDPQAVVVVITAHSGVSVAVRAMQAGASDFVTKPWNNARLLATVQSALALRRRRTSVLGEDRGREAEPEPVILGESPAIERVRTMVARVGPTGASVLLTGAAGRGKSLVARRLHLVSSRSDGPFVAAELAGLAAEEVERLLFGDGSGAAGAWLIARGGTLVLDEVGELTATLQGRLAALMDQGDREAPRLISTSRRPREALQGRGGLRDALLYRLNTVELALPALADRGDDAVLLAEHFLRLHARRHARTRGVLSVEAVAALRACPWKGDVREVMQAAERCVIFAEGPAYTAADLGLNGSARVEEPSGGGALDLRVSERALVATALKRHGFNVSYAARELGLTRPALYRRMAKHGL